MKLIRTEDNSVIDTGITPGISLEDVCAAHGVAVADHALVLEPHELKTQRQDSIATAFTGGRKDLEATVRLLMSLQGKSTNALVGSLNIIMQVFGNMLQSDDPALKQAAAPAAPLITQVTGLIENGDLLSVQSAQGISDTDAVLEGLFAMTTAAKAYKAVDSQANIKS